MDISNNKYSDKAVLFKPLILIIILASISIGVFLLVFQHYMSSLFEDVEKEYRQGLVNIVSVARNSIEPVLAKVRSGEITRDEAIQTIRPMIRNMTYDDRDGRNYILMIAYEGTVITHFYRPFIEMKSSWEFRDVNGVYIVQELVRAARTYPDGSFVRYRYSHVPDTKSPEEKLTYVVGLPEIECFLATGMYVQRTLKEQREILSNVEYASIWLFIIALIPVSVSVYVIIKRNRRLLAEISIRKKAESGLLENMELLRATLNATTDGILVVNKENRITQINRQFLDMWRIPADLQTIDEDERMLAFVVNLVADRDGFIAKVRALYQSRLDSLDEVVLKDGRIFERYSSPMIFGGNEIGRVWDFRDITKRKQAEESVKASRKLLNDVLQAASEFSIIATGPDGIITVFNRGAELMLGYSAEEMVGKQRPLILHLESELEERSRELTAELGYPVEGTRIFTAKPELEGSETREWTFVRKDGSTLLVSFVATAIRSDEGKITGYLGIANDITRRRQSEEKFSKIFMMAPDMISISRMTDGFIVDVNFGFEEITGWKRNEVIGRSSLDLNFWADPAKRASMVEELKAGSDVVHREISFRRKDGSLRTGIYSARSILIAGEEYLLFVMQDITERMQAEEKFSNIFMTTPDSIAISRMKDGKIMDVNPSFREFWGWEPEEVIGRTAFDIDFWVDRTEREHMVKELEAGKDVLYREFEFRRKDGAVRTGVYSARSLRIADELCILLIMRDITERKQAEEMSRLSEEKFSKIFMTTPDCIAITRMKDGKIMDVNPSFKEFWGWERNEVVGRTSLDINFWVDQAERARMVEDLEAGRDVLHREISYRHKDGSLRTGIYSARRIRIGGDETLIFVMQDITDRILLEEDRRKLEAQLHQSQKLDAIGQLAGGVAHDFNNILMSIEGNASLIMMDYLPDHPHYKRLSRIEESVERGAKLTRQLLGFAREGKYEVRVLSINDLVLNSARFFVETKKEIEADFQLEDGVYPVEGDYGQLEQVLLNIYINAGHAMPQGGRLHIQTTSLTLQEQDAWAFEVKPGDYVKISISDTGAGMDKETLKRIFEPFFTTKAQQGGSGLGLASAYGIIRNHGGIINAYSEPGQGSTFNIYLPSSEKKVATGESGKPVKKLLAGSGGILLVDDESEILNIASQLLEMLGYEVFKAESGQDAIAIYQEKRNRIELVILDMIMPGTSGFQTLQALKELNPSVKVILSSGYSLQGEARNVMEMGCMGFIQKPYNFAQLSGVVHKILNPDSGV
jgi:two-component system, cell cycle sensor histidine kinase and response regulator CckA